MPKPKKVGPLVREWRKAHGLDHAGLGHLLGCSRNHAIKLESEERPVTLEIAIRLAKVMSVPIEHLARPEDLILVRQAAVLLGYREPSIRKKVSRKRASARGAPSGDPEPQSVAAVAGLHA